MRKRLLLAALCALLVLSAVGVAACAPKEEYATDVVNGGFEKAVNNLDGWTKTGTAFSARGVVDKSEVNGEEVGKVGKNFFSGFDAGNQQFTGTLTSDYFVLSGTGKISFKLGAGKNPEKVYVAFLEKGSDTPLITVSNTAFQQGFLMDRMVRTVADLSAHVGKTVCIRLVDEDKGDEYAYINADDFKVLQSEAEATAALAEREREIAEYGAPVFTEDPTATTLTNGGFEDGLNNWLILEGNAFTKTTVVDADSKFWDTREFHAVGSKFLNGYAPGVQETYTGAMRSQKFTLKNGYISFLLGGSGSPNCYVTLHDGTTDEELVRVTNSAFKDPELSLNLHRVYLDARDYIDRVLYIKITDNAPAGPFGAITADDFRVSLTAEEVASLAEQTYNEAMALESNSINDYLKNHYLKLEYPVPVAILRVTERVKDTFISVGDQTADAAGYLSAVRASYLEMTEADMDLAIIGITKDGDSVPASLWAKLPLADACVYEITYTVAANEAVSETLKFKLNVMVNNNVMNGGFETGDLTGWQVLNPDVINADTAISSATEWWNERIPYNQSGSYHFDGWAACGDEGATYALRSSMFVLEGSGFISFKMGGNAAQVKVFKRDGTQIAEYNNTAFADVNFPNLDEGSRLATMTTFVADLSAYLGEELYLELHDKQAAAWAVAFFDEIVTYHETAPDVAGGKDTVQFYKKVDDVLSEEPTDYDIAWVEAVNAYVPAGE